MFWTVIKSSGLGLTCGHDRAKDGVFFLSFSESTHSPVLVSSLFVQHMLSPLHGSPLSKRRPNG